MKVKVNLKKGLVILLSCSMICGTMSVPWTTSQHSKVLVQGKSIVTNSISEQEQIPSIVSSTDNITVTPVGRRLFVSQTGANAVVTSPSTLGYYLFPESTDAYRMEADLMITSVGSSNNAGVFVGLFSVDNPVSRMVTAGFRGSAALQVRNIYSKTGGTIGAGGLNTNYKLGEMIHIVVTKTAKGVTTELTTSDGTSSATVSYGNMEFLTGISDNARYGFGIANSEVVIKNLKLLSEDGNSVLYDQNEYYPAVGTAPEVTSVGTPVLSEDRTTLSIEWGGGTIDGDGAFKVELSSDGGNTYTVLNDFVTEYQYSTKVQEDGAYRFRITGICGDEVSNSLDSEILNVMAPLDTPVLTTESGDGVISLSWSAINGAENYDIYRKSAEELEYSLLISTAGTNYEDHAVVNEMPYYYYIIAKSETNESIPSDILMTVPSGGRSGAYVYEEEATNISITRKTSDTVYSGNAILEGTVDKAGTMKLSVNDSEREQVVLNAGGAFSFQNISLAEGRNDVNLYFTDTDGKVTRKTFNFVYLTNYDVIVDGNYTGTEGAESSEVPGVKQYRTIQAAVDDVTNQSERTVILVKEGSYVEHLVISTANISLIGEDRENVNISFFDPVESPIGGDMSKRCAVYVTSSAANFTAENLTIENTYEYIGDGSISNESADALRVDAEGSMFVNVKLVGYQDTLDASSNRQYYEKCYITGNVDYIYGSAQALFNDCDLVFRYSPIKNSGYVTAPRTDANKYGYIFNNCRITAEEGCSGSKYLLARPWGQDGFAAFINCYMSDIINKTAPYSDMSGNKASEARFMEYYTYGGGFAINSLRPQISETQAEDMLSVTNLGWNPYEKSDEISQNYYVGDITTDGEE